MSTRSHAGILTASISLASYILSPGVGPPVVPPPPGLLCTVMLRTLAYATTWLIATAFFPPAGATPLFAQPVLTDSLYAAHHPRLLFSTLDITALRAKVVDGGEDDEAYDFIRDYVQDIYVTLPPPSLLGSFYGFEATPCIGLVAHFETPPDGVAMAQGRGLTTFIANAYNPDFNEAYSGMRLRSLALGYDLFFEDATETERAAIRDEMVLYLQLMTTSNAYRGFEYRPYLGNHSAMFGAALGLASICLQGEADATLLSNAMAMADRIVANLLAYQFDPGGAYNEGGLYALWTLRNLVYYFDARKRFDGYAFGDDATLRAVERWLPYELLPEGEAYSHNLNDSPYVTTPFARNASYFDWAMNEWNSGLSSWLWERSVGTYGVDLGMEADKVATVLWHRTIPPLQPTAVLPRHQVWLQRGLYYFRSGWQSDAASTEEVVFNFYSGKYQGAHAQEDQNQFALYAYGAKFVVDHGAGGIGKESEAHNMVFVDGRGQHNAGSSIGTDGRIAEYLLGGFADYVVGDATEAYGTYSEFNAPGVPFPGTDWSWGYSGANPVQSAYRRVLVVHGNAAPPYVVVMDDVDKDGAAHVYEWRMHTSASNNVNASSSPWTIGTAAATMDMHMLYPPVDSVLVATQPFENFNSDPNSTLLRVARTAVNPRFSFLLIPRRDTTPSPAVTRQAYPWGVACSIAWGEGVVDYVIRNDSGASVTYGHITTDGRVAWVREVNGAVDGYLAAGASSLVVVATQYVAIYDGTAVCEMSRSTIHMDRDDADFRFFDTGIASVCYREQSLGFAVDGGYIVPTGATAVDGVPAQRTLALVAYPNPFNPNTTIGVDGVAGEHVVVVVYDVAGRRVRRLWDAPSTAASVTIVWDGRDDEGQPVASGTYFLRASTPTASRTLKLTVLK